jgi:Carboxypeptidase regulatory-like domain
MRSILFALSLVVSVAGSVRAQPAVSTIRGDVLDPQHRGVMARIQAVQPRTGLTRETQSDPAGHFVITNIPPDIVDLVVTATGFAEHRVAGIQLEVGRTAEIGIELQVEGVSERLTVAGNAGTVDISSSVVGSVISAREIESLPLNGRNFLELALLTPGNTRAPNFDPTKAQSVVVSSAGRPGAAATC